MPVIGRFGRDVSGYLRLGSDCSRVARIHRRWLMNSRASQKNGVRDHTDDGSNR